MSIYVAEEEPEIILTHCKSIYMYNVLCGLERMTVLVIIDWFSS